MKKSGIILLVLLLSVAGISFAEGRREAAAPKAAAEQYPVKPIRLIVPYAAGGGTDVTARMIVQKLEKVVGQPVAIVNIGGAAGGLGMKEVINASPDGYTMGVDIINIWTRKALKTVEFGPEAVDLVAQCGSYYLLQAARTASPYKNLKELFDAAIKAPDTIQEATNIGAITHFTSLMLQDAVGAKTRLVHIGDGTQRITGVLGGHVEMTIMGTHEVLPYYKSKEMKVLAIASPERVAGLEDAPTAKEQGINVVQSVDYWFFMPKNTPKDKVDFMADAFGKVMQDPELVGKMKGMSMVPSFLKGAEFVKYVDEQGVKIMAVAEKHNLGKK
jgi:tripartite-type tricarboxylate transporter receptor subunit TctC